MTVESRQPKFFYPQFEIELTTDNNDYGFNKNSQFDYFAPSSGPTMAKGIETILLPKFADSLSHTLLSNKYLKDDSNVIGRFGNVSSPNTQEFWFSSLLHQFQQQQLDTNRILIEEMERVRMELAEKSKIRTKRMIDVISTRVSKKLKTKDEEIEKIEKLNWFLEEKTKSLNTEKQLWCDIAQNNEVAANNLRINLEQLLAQQRRVAIQKDADIVGSIPDAYSCCDSNHESNGNVVEITKKTSNFVINSKRLCKNCGKDESCILILPCRHLCLCAVCDFTIDNCPTCKSHIINRIAINM